MKDKNFVLRDGERQIEICLKNTSDFHGNNKHDAKETRIKYLFEGALKTIRIELETRIPTENTLRSEQDNGDSTEIRTFRVNKKQNRSQLIELTSFLIKVSHPFSESIQGYYIDIISDLLADEYCDIQNSVNEKKLKTFMSVTQYINANMRNDISVKDLMGISNMSERSLYYLFKDSVSLTPLAYIRKQKIAHLHRTLSDKNTQLSITKLAMDFGFTNLGRFSNLYRQQVGELPSETRMKYLRNT